MNSITSISKAKLLKFNITWKATATILDQNHLLFLLFAKISSFFFLIYLSIEHHHLQSQWFQIHTHTHSFESRKKSIDQLNFYAVFIICFFTYFSRSLTCKTTTTTAEMKKTWTHENVITHTFLLFKHKNEGEKTICGEELNFSI